jgi:hypothetical protein
LAAPLNVTPNQADRIQPGGSLAGKDSHEASSTESWFPSPQVFSTFCARSVLELGCGGVDRHCLRLDLKINEPAAASQGSRTRTLLKDARIVNSRSLIEKQETDQNVKLSGAIGSSFAISKVWKSSLFLRQQSQLPKAAG